MSTKQSSTRSKVESITSLIYALGGPSRKFSSTDIGAYLAPDASAEAREKAVERFFDDIRNEFGLQLQHKDIDGKKYYSFDTSDWYLPAIEFTPAESALIALAASLWKDSKLQAMGLRGAARVTGDKIDEATVALYSGALLPRVSIDEQNFQECALAVFNHKTVKFDYVGASGDKTVREVDLWGIGQRYGNWYFTGYDHSRKAARVFRLSRVQGSFKTVIRRDGPSSEDYQPRPIDFNMSQVLIDFDLQSPAYLATVQILRESATPLRARAINKGEVQDNLKIGYSDAESFAEELAAYGPAVKVIEPPALAAAVSALHRAARAAQEQKVDEIDLQKVKFRAQRAAGRGSTSVQVLRTIDMIQYVVSQGSVRIQELAQRYNMSLDKVRQELSMIMMCGVPEGLDDELINVNDGDIDIDTVTITNAELLGAPQKLAPLEAVAVLGGLNALRSVPDFEHGEILESALTKINDAVARYEGWSGALGFALAQAREDDIPRQLVAAIRDRNVLTIDYFSANSKTHEKRNVEPLRLVEDGPVQFLRAWCRKRSRLLTFRVDRILEVIPTNEHFELVNRHEDDETLDVRYHGSEDDLRAVLYVDDTVLSAVESFKPFEWSSSKVGSGYLAKVQLSYDLVPAPLVARYGGKITVVSPEATRQRVNDWLDEAIKIYEES